MAKKQVGFAGKARGKEASDFKFVKYVKSIRSEKTGQWRFNESMVKVRAGETLDQSVNRIQEEAMALDLEMPVFKAAAAESAAPEAVEAETTAEESQVAQ